MREPLKLKPLVVESPEDLDAALLQLKQIAAREKADAAELQARSSAIAEEIKRGQLVQVGRRKPDTFADHRGFLVGSIAAYCNAHRDELLPDEKVKSRKMTHGVVGWRKASPRLTDVNGSTATLLMLAHRSFGAGGLLGKVRNYLAGIAVNAAVAASDLFKLELKVDRDRILQLASEDKLSAEWLEKHNLKVVPGSDEFYAKPNDLIVQTEPARPAA